MVGIRLPRWRKLYKNQRGLTHRRLRFARANRNQWLFTLATALILTNVTVGKEIAGQVRKQPTGTSNQISRAQAIENIPMSHLTLPAQQKINHVVAKTSVYRCVRTPLIECDPNFKVFLLRNPNVVVDIWKLMGITRIDMIRTGNFSFETSDGMGTNCHVDLVYSRPDLHLYYAKGIYNGPLSLNPIHGECVVILKCQFSRSPNGSPLASSQLDVFLHLEGAAWDFLAKTFHPLFGKSVDLNFWETAEFLEHLSLTAQRNPRSILALANRLKTLQPDVRQKLTEIVTTFANDGQSRSPPNPLSNRSDGPGPASPGRKDAKLRTPRSRTVSFIHMSRFPPDGSLRR